MSNNRYDPADSFSGRFKVETRYGDETIDHQEFAAREYQKKKEGVYMSPPNSGLPTVQRGERKVIKPPKPAKAPVIKPNPKTKTNTDDAALKAANDKDIKNRNLKNK